MIPDHAVVTEYSSIGENEVADLEWSYHGMLLMFSKGKKNGLSIWYKTLLPD